MKEKHRLLCRQSDPGLWKSEVINENITRLQLNLKCRCARAGGPRQADLCYFPGWCLFLVPSPSGSPVPFLVECRKKQEVWRARQGVHVLTAELTHKWGRKGWVRESGGLQNVPVHYSTKHGPVGVLLPHCWGRTFEKFQHFSRRWNWNCWPMKGVPT